MLKFRVTYTHRDGQTESMDFEAMDMQDALEADAVPQAEDMSDVVGMTIKLLK